MEPVAVIPSKRPKLEKVTTSCLFCSTEDDALSTASQTGIHTVQKAHTQRTLYRSILKDQDILKLDRVGMKLLDMSPINTQCHKSCYASFTSKSNVQRLSERFNIHQAERTMNTVENISQNSVTMHDLDWEKCIFCQGKVKKETHQITNRDVADSIAELMIHDPRFNDTSDYIDLIYVGARYHTSCRQARKRKYNVEAPITNLNNYNAAFDELISQLNDGFRNGNVYCMNDITEQYHSLLHSNCVESTKIRADQLKSRLKHHFGDSISFRNQRQRSKSQLVMSNLCTGDAVEALTTANDNLKHMQNLQQYQTHSETNQYSFLRALHVHHVCA